MRTSIVDRALIEPAFVRGEPGHWRQVSEPHFSDGGGNLEPVPVRAHPRAAVERLLVGVAELEAAAPRLPFADPLDLDQHVRVFCLPASL